MHPEGSRSSSPMSARQNFEPEWDQGLPPPGPPLAEEGQPSEYWEMDEGHNGMDDFINHEDDEDDEHFVTGFLPLQWKGQRYHTHEFGGCDYLEDFEQYRPGGHHPVHLGDCLGEDERFQVWHKLGQGGYGIVWLCFDRAAEVFCAVKVLLANLFKHTEKLVELKLPELLEGASGREAYDNHIVTPFETFTQHGPNGEHLCLVMPVMGPSITQSRAYNWNNIPLLKGLCYQLVKGMDFMHRHGLCHGDFRPSNILFKTTLGGLTPEEMERYLPRPHLYVIVMAGEYDKIPSCGPNAPEYAVRPLYLTLEDECITTEIAIVDFGVAFEVGKPTPDSAIPEKYAAPECQREVCAPPSMGSDLWALGCTMTEVLCDRTPCQFGGGFSFQELEMVLGPMPEPYRSKHIECFKRGHTDYRVYGPALDPTAHLLWEPHWLERRRKKCREEYGTDDALYEVLGHEVTQFHPDSFRDPPKTTSEDVLSSEDRNKKKTGGSTSIKRRFDRAEVPGAVDLLRQVLRWFPEDRVSAGRLLDHKWFEGRLEREDDGPEESTGSEFDDIPMEEIALPAELSVRKEDLPPPPQGTGGGALVGTQNLRLDNFDLLHYGPFVPKSIWGFFQKALCVKPRN